MKSDFKVINLTGSDTRFIYVGNIDKDDLVVNYHSRKREDNVYQHINIVGVWIIKEKSPMQQH